MKPSTILPGLSLLATLAMLGSSAACVSAKDYKELEADLAKARDELTKSRGEAKDLGIALQETQQQVDMLNIGIVDLERALGEAKDALADTEGALALAEVRASDAETELAEVIKARSKLAASVEEMQAALAELQRQRQQAEVRLAVYRSVLAKFKEMIDNGKLKVKVVDGRMVLQLQTDILFSSGSAKLSDVGEATVQEVGKLLSEIPDRRFQVEGHTDNVPINTKTYPSNWELASARAINVTTAMVAAGMPASRLSAASFADTRPTHKNDTEEGRAQNRRIEIVLVPDLSDLPGAEEIEKMFKSSTT
jgi:chemotaxis protein MotB